MRVLVNAATSVDGKLSSREREQIAISGEEDFARVDRLRAEADAIAVGIGTVLADDPSLVRHDGDHRREVRGEVPPPARVVADSKARLPHDAAILEREPGTYVLASEIAPPTQVEALREAGARVFVTGEQRVDLPAAFDRLEEAGVEHLLVEGGGELLFSLFEADLVDRVSVFVGSIVIGGREAPTLVDGEGFVSDFPVLELESVREVDDGVLTQWSVGGG